MCAGPYGQREDQPREFWQRSELCARPRPELFVLAVAGQAPGHFAKLQGNQGRCGLVVAHFFFSRFPQRIAPRLFAVGPPQGVARRQADVFVRVAVRKQGLKVAVVERLDAAEKLVEDVDEKQRAPQGFLDGPRFPVRTGGSRWYGRGQKRVCYPSLRRRVCNPLQQTLRSLCINRISYRNDYNNASLAHAGKDTP
ncbi:uncharacterized protein SPSK_01975 [Sporothrix schenckii 1099-18]|uniref:Uncharacterized protein n=1 Tax=Sporothrix schenckii 1099-18 TaxID=1397361 RepID=A0A0F2MFE3_SPOSC|nr:uncharacterized protein SPSK_01975 [Sporothrix schenckii 1099-18]KJR87550.1 hypothetical protein SPSK_01975 [Sporothrix schenckii 1099-18]